MLFLAVVDNCQKLKFEPATRELMNIWLKSLPPGQIVSVEISKPKVKRSDPQLKAFWGMIMTAAREAMTEQGWDCMGVPLADEQIKKLLYHYCGGVGSEGRMVRLSKQNVQECSEFFERCRNWLANFGIIVPDPDRNWRDKIDASEVNGQADATEDDGVTDGTEAGLPLGEGDTVVPHYLYACDACSQGYNILPEGGHCMTRDEDNFPCMGKVGPT